MRRFLMLIVIFTLAQSSKISIKSASYTIKKKLVEKNIMKGKYYNAYLTAAN